jgi:hypothetical protein
VSRPLALKACEAVAMFQIQYLSGRTLSRTSAKGRKQRFKLRHYRKAPAKAIAAAPERPASGNQCERIRKLMRWHRDELGAERKAAAVEMRDSLDALLDIFHKPGHLRRLQDALERAS